MGCMSISDSQVSEMPAQRQMDCFQIDRDSEDPFTVRNFGAYGWAVNARNSSLLLVVNRGTGTFSPAMDGRHIPARPGFQNAVEE